MVCEECVVIRDRLRVAEKRIEELERKLEAYENAHTPSSRRRFPPKIENSSKKRAGQKEGHIGVTRGKREPTIELEVVEDRCFYCDAKLGEPFKKVSRIIEEIPEPKPVEVIKYNINHYRCKRCGKITVSRAKIPTESRFGANTLAHVTLLKFEDRLPLKKVCNTISRQFNLDLSAGTVFDITRRVSDKLLPEYEKIRLALRRSQVVYADETGIRVNGLNYHLWVFTNKDATLFAIRNSRGKNVIEEVLGEKFNGIITSDGWTSYSTYTNRIQRCWAHLLREAKFLAEKYDSANPLYNGLKTLFEKAKCAKPPDKDKLIFEMMQWVQCSSAYKELRKFTTKILNGIEHWFTFVQYPFVEPTNNRAERALRELIVQRKIIGTLRNQKGSTIMERINSCIITWKQNRLSSFYEIKNRLC